MKILDFLSKNSILIELKSKIKKGKKKMEKVLRKNFKEDKELMELAIYLMEHSGGIVLIEEQKNAECVAEVLSDNMQFTESCNLRHIIIQMVIEYDKEQMQRIKENIEKLKKG